MSPFLPSILCPPLIMVDNMDIDVQPQANGSSHNVMSTLMANAKGKAKAETNGTTNGTMTDAEMRAANEREGLPWCVYRFMRGSWLRSRVEKYRPTTFEEVVSHQDITGTSEFAHRSNTLKSLTRAVEKFIEAGRLPHLLLYGPPGQL